MSKQANNQNLDVNETLAKSEAIIVKYKKQIITAVVAIVVVVGGTFAYIYGYSKPREDKAQELLGIAMQKYIMTQDYEKALKGEGKTLGLEAIASKYGSTDAGNVAKYEAGLCLYQLGKTKEAIKYLEDFSTQGDATISAQALFALANCYASDKQLDKAVDTFKKAAKETNSAQNTSSRPVSFWKTRRRTTRHSRFTSKSRPTIPWLPSARANSRATLSWMPSSTSISKSSASKNKLTQLMSHIQEVTRARATS